jgi:hypothetical protein
MLRGVFSASLTNSTTQFLLLEPHLLDIPTFAIQRIDVRRDSAKALLSATGRLEKAEMGWT